VARILVLHRRRPRRELWSDALERAGYEVDPRDCVKSARMALWQFDYDGIVAETPCETDLTELLESAPGPWPPPILLIGAPYGEPVGVPRAFAAALCVDCPAVSEVPALLRGLLSTARITHPAVPFGRTDVPLRLPPQQVSKWKSWLYAA
jgi:hypothetical protein